MLCEALTRLPHSMVFNEPNLGFRNFAVRTTEAELLGSLGIDLRDFVKRWSVGRRRLLLYGVRKRLIPRIQRHVAQVGIKEIFHTHWRRVLRMFPEHRIVLTSRDPRDIYLSLRGRYLKGHAIWTGDFTPRRVADSLNAEFARQLDMARSSSVMHVRYEDLCTEPDAMTRVLRFVGSDLREAGSLGEFLRGDERRVSEGAMHGGRITDKRVSRWRQETGDIAAEAAEVFDLMPDYCKYWSYGKDGPLELGLRIGRA